MEKQAAKISPTVFVLGFYVLYYLLYLVTQEFAHGGPCSPGLDLLILLLFPILTFIITIVTGVTQRKNKKYILPFVLSLLVTLATFIMIVILLIG